MFFVIQFHFLEILPLFALLFSLIWAAPNHNYFLEFFAFFCMVPSTALGIPKPSLSHKASPFRFVAENFPSILFRLSN